MGSVVVASSGSVSVAEVAVVLGRDAKMRDDSVSTKVRSELMEIVVEVLGSGVAVGASLMV